MAVRIARLTIRNLGLTGSRTGLAVQPFVARNQITLVADVAARAAGTTGRRADLGVRVAGGSAEHVANARRFAVELSAGLANAEELHGLTRSLALRAMAESSGHTHVVPRVAALPNEQRFSAHPCAVGRLVAPQARSTSDDFRRGASDQRARLTFGRGPHDALDADAAARRVIVGAIRRRAALQAALCFDGAP